MYGRIKRYVIHEYLAETVSFHDRSRITLLFNIAYATFILGTIASFVSLILGTYPILIPGLGNVVLAGIALVILKSKNISLAAKIYFSALFCLLFGNLIFNYGTMHIGSPFWIMLINILVLYILDIWWGLVFLLLSSFGFIYYIHNVFPRTIEIVSSLPKATYFSAYYETFFALFLLGYIIYTIIKASRNSDELLQSQNRELTFQNSLISAKNAENTVMLKEIHHRVKNNLQVIISLLRLQMREINHQDSLDKFSESINRVLTMALIHEKIYQSEELSNVDLEQYFKSLSQDLISSYQVETPVEIDLHFDIKRVGLTSIVPLALIFNELFSNSIKHAFKDHHKPKIRVGLIKLTNDKVLFEYQDNGIWKTENSTSSFGLELIESLTEQLDGTMELKKEPVTHYRFLFNHLNE